MTVRHVMRKLSQRPAVWAIRPLQASVPAHLHFLPEQPRKLLEKVNRLLALLRRDLLGKLEPPYRIPLPFDVLLPVRSCGQSSTE